jgi:hypothetical protein
MYIYKESFGVVRGRGGLEWIVLVGSWLIVGKRGGYMYHVYKR